MLSLAFGVLDVPEGRPLALVGRPFRSTSFLRAEHIEVLFSASRAVCVPEQPPRFVFRRHYPKIAFPLSLFPIPRFFPGSTSSSFIETVVLHSNFFCCFF